MRKGVYAEAHGIQVYPTVVYSSRRWKLEQLKGPTEKTSADRIAPELGMNASDQHAVYLLIHTTSGHNFFNVLHQDTLAPLGPARFYTSRSSSFCNRNPVAKQLAPLKDYGLYILGLSCLAYCAQLKVKKRRLGNQHIGVS